MKNSTKLPVNQSNGRTTADRQYAVSRLVKIIGPIARQRVKSYGLVKHG